MKKSTGLLSGFFNIGVIPSNLKKRIESGRQRSTMKVREQRVRLCWRATGALPPYRCQGRGSSIVGMLRIPQRLCPLFCLPWQWFQSGKLTLFYAQDGKVLGGLGSKAGRGFRLGFRFSIGSSEQTGAALLLEAVAFALDVEGGGVVQQAIQHGGGQHRIVEDFAPVEEALVGRDDQAGAFVAASDRRKNKLASTRERDR